MEKKESKFLKISCPRCRKSQTVFGKSATRIKCLRCNKLLIKNTGGKCKIKARVQEILQ